MPFSGTASAAIGTSESRKYWTPAIEILQHIGPLGHEHLNLIGHYNFDSMQQFSLHNLLPLRSTADIEIVDEDDIEAYVTLSGLF